MHIPGNDGICSMHMNDTVKVGSQYMYNEMQAMQGRGNIPM